jgi:hypothetical protein
MNNKKKNGAPNPRAEERADTLNIHNGNLQLLPHNHDFSFPYLGPGFPGLTPPVFTDII